MNTTAVLPLRVRSLATSAGSVFLTGSPCLFSSTLPLLSASGGILSV